MPTQSETKRDIWRTLATYPADEQAVCVQVMILAELKAIREIMEQSGRAVRGTANITLATMEAS